MEYVETNQSKTLKALNRYGEEADIRTIAELINKDKKKTQYCLWRLFKKKLVKRRIEYIKKNRKTFPVAYYRINEENIKQVKFWLKNY